MVQWPCNMGLLVFIMNELAKRFNYDYDVDLISNKGSYNRYYCIALYGHREPYWDGYKMTTWYIVWEFEFYE